MLQFAGTTVDGEGSDVYPPLLDSNIRYWRENNNRQGMSADSS